MQFEVEQKFRIADSAQVQEKLRALGARDQGTVEQVDRYFNHPSRDFAQTDEALRLRSVGETNFITYKGPKLDATTKTRHEIELPLPPGSTVASDYATLLTALGFRFVAKVHKARRQLHVDWQESAVEIALDEVSGLGSFLELEIVAEQSGIEPAKAAIASLATNLGLAESERRSYLELLLQNQ